MSEPKNTSVDLVYRLLMANNVDSLLALKGALRYFAANEGRELVDVEIGGINFRRDDEGEDHLAVHGRLVG